MLIHVNFLKIADYNPEDLQFTHDRNTALMIIRKPGALIGDDFRIDIHTWRLNARFRRTAPLTK